MGAGFSCCSSARFCALSLLDCTIGPISGALVADVVLCGWLVLVLLTVAVAIVAAVVDVDVVLKGDCAVLVVLWVSLWLADASHCSLPLFPCCSC